MANACPKCGATTAGRVAATSGFAVASDYKCNACGIVWRPPWPQPAAAIALVAGLILAVPCTWVALDALLNLRGLPVVPIFLGFSGWSFVVFAIAVLIGKTGKLRIITPEPQHDQRVSKSLDDWLDKPNK
jgi:hypothetical protein